MPRIKSARKALRQSSRRRQENLKKMSSLRASVKTYKKGLSEKDEATKRTSLSEVYRALDKAAKTKLIKKNKARRLKSRLARVRAS
ncbi:MAG: 30S ribosomal protein S20 [Parcubacteria group bacterium]|jgi:ribosomal protein S20